jgi:putative ABC transport system permease protein
MKMQLTLALRYLLGRKLRTFLTTLAIAFGVLVLFGMNAVAPSLERAFQLNIRAAFGEADASVVLKTSDVFDASVAADIAAVQGVEFVSGFLNRPINFPKDYFDHDPAQVDRVTAVSLVGIDVDQARAIHAYKISEGRFLDPNDSNAVVITESLASSLGLDLGDEFPLPSAIGEARLNIVGLLPARVSPGSEEIIVNLETAQRFLDLPGKINTVETLFVATDEAGRSATQQRLLDALGSSYQAGELSANSQFTTSLELGRIIFNLLGVLALLMGGFIIFNTFRTIVAERRRDIGMLRTLGANRSTILGVLLAEGLIQGILGSAIGMSAGYLMAALLTAALNPLLGQFMSVAVDGPVVTPSLIVLSLVLGLGVTLVSAVLPSWQATRVTPLEALRPSLGEVSLRRLAGWDFWSGVALIAIAIIALLSQNTSLVGLGGVLFLFGLFLVTPAMVTPVARLLSNLIGRLFARGGTAQLAEGNLSRQPGRAATTASTTLIALAIVVMAAAVISSMLLGFEQVLRKSLGADYLLIPPSVAAWGGNVGASQDLRKELSAVDGVELISTSRFAPSLANDVHIELMGIEPQAFPQVSGLEFSQGDEETAYASLGTGRNLIVNGIFASNVGASVGDNVDLTTANGSQTYRIVAVATDYLNAKLPTAMISQANLAADFGTDEDLLYYINLESGADSQAVVDELRAILIEYPQFRLLDGEAYIQENLALFNSAFAGLVGMVLFLAIPSLIAMVNTLAIGVIERTREIGMLRAIGATRPQVRSMVLTEALILSGIGTVFGILAGLYLGFLAIHAVESLGFPMQFTFPFSGVLLGVSAGIVFGILAALIPSRQATRIQVVEALRYE